MSYDWSKETEEGGPSAKIPPGRHEVTITKVIYTSNNVPFATQDGDPQIMLIFTDQHGRELPFMVTLAEKVSWPRRSIAPVMRAVGANIARMVQDNITPAHFANQRFADAQLINRRLTIVVSEKAGRDGKVYTNIELVDMVNRIMGQAVSDRPAAPAQSAPAPAAASNDGPTVDPADIPF